MGRVSFENFGCRAENLDDHTLVAGRAVSQKESEKLILPDIVSKLDIRPDDDCLDIGCGTGNLTIPLSFLAGTVTGVDHSSCVEKLRNRCGQLGNVRLEAGNFLDIPIPGHFHKVFAYSVLHYLKDREEVFGFVFKAAALVSPGGKVLLGDIPNESRKKRFLETEQGRAFDADWRRREKQAAEETRGEASVMALASDAELVKFDDDLVLSIVKEMRQRGYHAYVLPQPSQLPFGHTREDILIEKPY